MAGRVVRSSIDLNGTGTIRFLSDRDRYEVEIYFAWELVPRTVEITGFAVRRAGDGLPLELAHVRRLRLNDYMRAARIAAVALIPEGPTHIDEAARIARAAARDAEKRAFKIPAGRPQRGRAEGFYREVAHAYVAASSAGRNPIRAIARAKKVDENTVHQWVFQTRRRGLLPPAPPRRKGKR